jgi:hypothetical protein
MHAPQDFEFVALDIDLDKERNAVRTGQFPHRNSFDLLAVPEFEALPEPAFVISQRLRPFLAQGVLRRARRVDPQGFDRASVANCFADEDQRLPSQSMFYELLFENFLAGFVRLNSHHAGPESQEDISLIALVCTDIEDQITPLESVEEISIKSKLATPVVDNSPVGQRPVEVVDPRRPGALVNAELSE